MPATDTNPSELDSPATRYSPDACERVPVDSLNLDLGRRVVPPGAVESLADDILAHGLQQAIHLAADRRLVVGGTNRSRAFQLLAARHPGDPRWGTIPAVVLAHLVTPAACLRWLLSGDVQTTRHPLDTAFLVRDFSLQHPALSDAAVAAQLGLSPAKLCRCKKALDYDPDVLAAIRSGGLGMDHLLAVSPVKDRARRHELLRRAAAECWTAKATREHLCPKQRGAFGEIKADGLVLRYPRGWDAGRLEAALGGLKDYVAKRTQEAAKGVKSLPLAVILRANGEGSSAGGG